MSADLRHIRTPTLDIAYEESGDAEWRAGLSHARLALRSALLRRGRAAARCRRLPRDRALSARLWRDAISVRRHAALGPAGGARQRFARIHGCACRSSAPCSPATIGAAARPASSRHCGRSACAASSPATATTFRTSRRRRSRHRRSKSAASGTSIIFTPSARVPALKRTAAASAACSGNYGRRIGNSMTRRSSAAPSRSTIPISSR